MPCHNSYALITYYISRAGSSHVYVCINISEHWNGLGIRGVKEQAQRQTNTNKKITFLVLNRRTGHLVQVDFSPFFSQGM